MTRAEHLKWCKEWALEYLQPGPYFDVDQAMASMLSDMGKHDETRDHIACGLMVSLRVAGQLSSAEQMREFINGFN